MPLLVRVVFLLCGGAGGFVAGCLVGLLPGTIMAPTSNLNGIGSLITGPIGAVVAFFWVDRKMKRSSRP